MNKRLYCGEVIDAYDIGGADPEDFDVLTRYIDDENLRHEVPEEVAYRTLRRRLRRIQMKWLKSLLLTSMAESLG